MTTTPTKTVISKTVNNNTGVTTSKSTVTTGKSVTTTSTKTIGKAKPVTAAKKTAVKTPAKLAREALGSRWLVGPNDTRPLCAPVAVANALLGALLTEPTNAQIERLYRAAGGIGEHAAPLPSVLAAAAAEGLGGYRLKDFRPAGLDVADVLLLDLPDGLGVHAAAFAGMNVIAWGDEIPLPDMNARIIGAWSLTWHGQKEAC